MAKVPPLLPVKKTFGWYVQRYWPSVFFPVFLGGLVIADYTHTQNWKRLQKENGS